MKKITVLCLAVIMVFSMLCPVMAETELPALASLSLSENVSYYSSAVPEGTVLKIKGFDAVGNDRALSDVTFTYTSTRPWVLDVDENGNIVDGGYEGTTIITAKSGDMEASLLFIKASDNGTNTTRGFETNLNVTNQNSADYPYQSWMDAGAIAHEAGGHDGKTYYELESGKTALIQYRGSWDNAANIRVGQVWFYDDGTSEINARLRFCQVNPRTVYYKTNKYVVGGENTPDAGAYGYTNAWAALGLDESIVASVVKDTENGFYYYGAVGADENGTNYTYHLSKKDSGITRTKGWHQATLIVDEDGTANTYLDGVLIGSEAFSKSNGAGGTAYVGGESVGYFDDMVMVANLNTTKPVVNITVSYDEAKGSVSCNNNKVANGGKVEAYYDGSVNFTFEPAEGFELDTVTYDGTDVTAFIQDGVLGVDCKNAELEVTFKEVTPVAPTVAKTVEIKTDEKVGDNPAALMYMQIQSGKGYTVTDTGIVISDKENAAENGLKLTALNQDKTNVTSGMFGIRVYGEGLNGIKCYYRPFITYEKDGQSKTDYNGTEESFTLPEKK